MSRFPAMGTAHFCFMEHWILAVSTAQAVQTVGFVQVLLAGFRLKIDVPKVGDCLFGHFFFSGIDQKICLDQNLKINPVNFCIGVVMSN